MSIDQADVDTGRSSEPSLLTAGQFASATLLSPKALRIYAGRGLLSPDRIDPVNGYRGYHRDQVPTGWLIGLLRSAGLSLDEIDAVIHTGTDQALGLLDEAAVALRRRTHSSLALIERARLHLTKETPMSNVSTSVVADQPVLSVLRRMRPEEMDGVITAELDRLRAIATSSGLTETGPPFGVFHGPIDSESDGPLEISLPVDALVDTENDVRSYRMPGGRVANRDAVAPETDYPDILTCYDELHAWITGGGRTTVGPPREIWHNSPSGPDPLHLTISWPYVD